MKFSCCGLIYDTRDPATYWCIEKFRAKILSKKQACGVDVSKEIVYILTCKKNGCLKIRIQYYGKTRLGFKLLDSQEISGQAAEEFYINSMSGLESMPIKCPSKHSIGAKNIPWTFPKITDATTQRRRMLNDCDWIDKYKQGLIAGRWEPDTYKSEVKVSYLSKDKQKDLQKV